MSAINQITVGNTTYDVQDLISRPILTQAEYNALEQAGLVDPDKDYHISNGMLAPTPVDDNDVSTEKTWSSAKINEVNSYSTDEVVVGTWTDGKPIYRKVITNTMPSTGVSSFPPTNTTSAKNINLEVSVDTFVTISGFMNNNGAYNELGIIITGNMWSSIWGRNNTSSNPNTIALLCGNSAVDLSCTIVIEYTKTTDPIPT